MASWRYECSCGPFIKELLRRCCAESRLCRDNEGLIRVTHGSKVIQKDADVHKRKTTVHQKAEEQENRMPQPEG